MTLRQHMQDMHDPSLVLPRRTETLVRLHMDEHHRFLTSHHHGPTAGPHDRPIGWTTGENVVLRERVVPRRQQ